MLINTIPLICLWKFSPQHSEREQVDRGEHLPTYMMEVAVMSHMAGAKKSSGLKLWPGLNEGSGLRLSWHSKMWKTSRQLNSPRNMPTAWAQPER